MYRKASIQQLIRLAFEQPALLSGVFMTPLLEAYAQGLLQVRLLSQQLRRLEAAIPELALNLRESILERKVLLQGRDNHPTYLYAETMIVPSALPAPGRQEIPLLSLEPHQQYRAFHAMLTEFKDVSTLGDAKAIALKDRERLNRALNFIKTETTKEALRRAFGGNSSEQVQQTVRKVRYDHGAILLTTEPSLVNYWLAQKQFGNASILPSSIVARRLEKRHGVPSPTTILRANITIPDPDQRLETVKRQVEVFLAASAAQTWERQAIEAEQAQNYESHTAFVVNEGFAIKDVRADFLNNGLKPDGGGTNTVGNSTTLYFINEQGERFELIQYGKTENELADLHECRLTHKSVNLSDGVALPLGCSKRG